MMQSKGENGKNELEFSPLSYFYISIYIDKTLSKNVKLILFYQNLCVSQTPLALNQISFYFRYFHDSTDRSVSGNINPVHQAKANRRKQGSE